jgi:hypothetical protein
MGTWRYVETRVGAQPIMQTSTTQNHPFGTIVRARDVGTTAYGEGEFIYCKGVSSGALNAWAGVRSKAGLTTLATASGAYDLVGVMMATLDATTKFGWMQIKGRAIGKVLTQYADNAVVYLTGTAGSMDDASVAGDVIVGAHGRNGGTVTVGDLAGEFELNRPFTLRRTAPTG